MPSKTLATLMRVSTIATAICGLFLSVFIISAWWGSIVWANQEISSWFLPWLIFVWIAALPCFVILVCIWKVAGAVSRETVFTQKTANWVKAGAVLLLSDAAFVLIGNAVFALLKMNHPGVLLVFIIGDVFAFALAMLAAVLSRYLTKAAVLQEESEGTL